MIQLRFVLTCMRLHKKAHEVFHTRNMISIVPQSIFPICPDAQSHSFTCAVMSLALISQAIGPLRVRQSGGNASMTVGCFKRQMFCLELSPFRSQLREEQDTVRSKYGDELGSKAVNNMPYALATVKEVMRHSACHSRHLEVCIFSSHDCFIKRIILYLYTGTYQHCLI